jgi:hypothetical protein
MVSRNATVFHLAGRVLPLATLYFIQIWTVQVRMDRTGMADSSERHRHLSYLDIGPWWWDSGQLEYTLTRKG